jgi:hypothetical protein
VRSALPPVAERLNLCDDGLFPLGSNSATGASEPSLAFSIVAPSLGGAGEVHFQVEFSKPADGRSLPAPHPERTAIAVAEAEAHDAAVRVIPQLIWDDHDERSTAVRQA